MQSIPLVNLERQYQRLQEEIQSDFQEIMRTGAFIQGKWVQAFEERFNMMHGASYGAGCANGTAAITVLLQALGLQAGDEVITTTHTFYATAEALIPLGVRPVLVDIDPKTYNLNVELVESKITSRTRAILPVHLYGIPADLKTLRMIASKHGLLMIEDCAQAHFAKFEGKYVGTQSDGASFSFYPGKNLGAAGDAGYVFTKDVGVLKKFKKLIDHGRSEKYLHDAIGYNYRMDGIQGAILLRKLALIEQWTARRQFHAKSYHSKLKARGFKVPEASPDCEPVWHLLTVEVSNRDEALQVLHQNGIQAGIHYPVPLHLQPGLSFLGYTRGDFPEAERVASRVMSLPLCGELTDQERDYILDVFFKVAQP